MFLETVRSEGLSHLSYLLGDGVEAAVIDPRRDCGIYPELAERHGARITHIFETHRNEDYVVGSLELARLTGADIRHGAALPFGYGLATRDGDRFDFGNARISVLETPGHTDESLSFVLADMASSEDPVAVFTGDALFIGDVGRTDFYPDRAREVAGLLYDSIFEKLLPLGDHVVLCPAHGAGSVCGGGMADRELSTLGYERRHNPALQVAGREAFIERKVAERHHMPPYFRRMEKANLEGPPPLGRLVPPRPLSAAQVEAAREGGLLVIDVRSPEAAAGAHIPDSLALPLDMIASYAGWFVPYDVPLVLVAESSGDATDAQRFLARLGFDRVQGYLEGGMTAWEASGGGLGRLNAISAATLKERLESGADFTILDVRSEDEYSAGHLPGAVNIHLGELPARLDGVPSARPVTTICSTGRRATVAASLLRRLGVEDVETCLGSMEACRAVGCPTRAGP